MIVTTPDRSTDKKDQWVLITQTDHAGLAADILRLMPGLADHPLRAELIRAAREHDNGWAEADSAPRVDARGRPHDFRSMPSAERLELWRRGAARHLKEDPAVALLILHHALHLHRNPPDEQWLETLDVWRDQDETLRRDLLLDEALVNETYRHLQLADNISLAACGALDATSSGDTRITRRDTESSDHFTVVRVDPFPLAGATTFRVSGRRIPRRAYENSTSLAMATAKARWERFHILISP